MNIQHNIQLQPYNSFQTKAEAKLFCRPQTPEEVMEALQAYPHENKLIIGKGCNLFFTTDYDGLVIVPALRGIHILKEDAETVEIEAMAGEDWDEFVQFCVDKEYAGVENLSLIPGHVGASPIQNIGAYGTEVKDVIKSVRAMELSTGKIIDFSNEECRFAYRDSYFKQTRKHLILSVVFQLHKTFVYKEKYADLKHELANVPSPSLRQVREAIIQIRTRKLPNPAHLPNAGSFFKNPILSEEEKDALLELLPQAPIYAVENNRFKTSAAYLIDKAVYKVKRNGKVGIYKNHSLIIVNYGTENGQDIVRFMHEVQDAVRTLYSISLQPEVWIF